MAHVDVHREFEFDTPTLVEGLPGVGLVGKIATDHIVETLEMEYYASCRCDGLPRVAVYNEGDRDLRPPVRLYADPERDLLALQSDVPVSPEHAPEFAACLSGWFDANDVTPLFLSGLAEEKDGVPEMYGVGTNGGTDRLEAHGIDSPPEGGLISGPAGALLAEAGERALDSVGLIVQANRQFPDPEAARVLIVDGIEPLAGIDVETDRLVEQAEQIATAREELAERMQEANQESSQARPLGMYQ
jgi:uncharacterized protein